jgi:serine/threonine protein kinase
VPPAPLDDGRKLVGSLIAGRYLVGEVIGAGGKGTVYEAHDQALGRDVAIKVPIEGTEDSIKRFLREGRAGASVAHPNVCAIYDFGPLEDGTPFLVMERLVGEPLSVRLTRQPRTPPAEALPLLQQVLAGLEAAHQQGIVHRDIKPANVFLAQTPGLEDVAKILDFGASMITRDAPGSVTDDFEALTKIGTAIGTPIYMCAEQVRGQRDLDRRVDLYACGVILYEAITGVPPFNAPKRVELFRLILAGNFTPASHIEPRATPELDAILARALATDRIHRYPDARSFGAALEALRLEGLSPRTHRHSSSPADSLRLVALQQRLEEVSSYYVESATALRAARPVGATDVPADVPVDIPIDVDDEEQEPDTLRDVSLTLESHTHKP